jgi:hypothetical protein
VIDAHEPRRATVIAALLTGVIGLATLWSIGGRLPGGDEPHYLVITQSLLRDGDLRIENNHTQGDYAEYFGGTLRPDFINRGQDGEIYSIHAWSVSARVAGVCGVWPAWCASDDSARVDDYGGVGVAIGLACH